MHSDLIILKSLLGAALESTWAPTAKDSEGLSISYTLHPCPSFWKLQEELAALFCLF